MPEFVKNYSRPRFTTFLATDTIIDRPVYFLKAVANMTMNDNAANGTSHSTVPIPTATTNGDSKNSFLVKAGLAQMLKGGVIMDVVNAEQARIAEEAGACAVMALERVPADIRKDGGVARMSDPELIKGRWLRCCSCAGPLTLLYRHSSGSDNTCHGQGSNWSLRRMPDP